MASRRMVPTRFFKDPDIMNLSSKDTQLILIGLILAADDEGREVAHAGLLGREMDYPAEQIETALQELVSNDLLFLYQVGKHRYYQLTRWNQWQTLGGRTTPSRYPAPPDSPCSGETEKKSSNAENAGNVRGKVGEESGKSRGNDVHFPDQFNLTESNLTKNEGGKDRLDDLHLPQGHICKVVPFPPSRARDGNGNDSFQKTHTPSETGFRDLAQQIACILRLPVTDALQRIIDEYALVAAFSLPGEADAAREWIDDPRRNRKRRNMSPAFFRNWLKREMGALEQRQAAMQQVVQATGTVGSPNTTTQPSVPRSPNLMHLAKEDALAKEGKVHE